MRGTSLLLPTLLLSLVLACLGACDAAVGSTGSPDADVGAGADGGAGTADAGGDADADPGATASEETYRLMHWNIAGGKENGCRTAGITSAVVDFVRERNIDFVGLNEVCPAQYNAIEDALRAHWSKGATEKFSSYIGDKTGRIVGNAIFSRFGIQNVTKDKVGEDQYGDRNLLCGVVPAYSHLRFCSVHLSPADARARVQLDKVLTRLENWWQQKGDTVLWSGDLNLRPNDPGLNAVYSSGANHAQNNPGNTGAYREVDDADADNCLGYGERSLPNVTGGPCQAGGKIDFIFARENRIIDGEYSGNTLNIPNSCTGACSDHRPVIGQVRVRIRND